MRTMQILLAATLAIAPACAPVPAGPVTSLPSAAGAEPPVGAWARRLVVEAPTDFATLRGAPLPAGPLGERRWDARLGSDGQHGLVMAIEARDGAEHWLFTTVLRMDAAAGSTPPARDPRYLRYVAAVDSVVAPAWVRDPRTDGKHYWVECPDGGGRTLAVSTEPDGQAGRAYLLTVLHLGPSACGPGGA